MAEMEHGLGLWPIRIKVPVAWGDMDALGHVNNTVYLRWFETARILYFDRLSLMAEMNSKSVGPILARQTTNYRIPLTYPDTVTVHVTATALGRTSFTMAYRIFSDKSGGALAAEGEGVVVMVDYAAGEKVPLSDALRQAILTLESTTAA